MKLKEICNITMGSSPKSENILDDAQFIPFLQGNRTFNNIYPDVDKYTDKITKIAKEGSILFSVRAPVGDINIAPCDCCIGRGIASIEAINCSREYLFYWLKKYNFDTINRTSGTIYGSVNRNFIENLELKDISIEEQKEIADRISVYDDKIENNNKIINTLEEMASLLYKRYFVDFEFPNDEGRPYKSNGGQFIDSELGQIPINWSIATIGSLVAKKKNKIKDFNDWENGQVIDLSVMPQFSIAINSTSEGSSFKTNIYKLEEFDILFGSIRSYFGKAGFSPIDGFVTGTVHCFNTINVDDYAFILFLISSKSFIDYSVSVSQGTKMPIFKYDDLECYEVPYNVHIVKQYNEQMSSLIHMISNLIKENKVCVQVRDLLINELIK